MHAVSSHGTASMPGVINPASKRMQPQPTPEREREIDSPELAHPLHAHATQIDMRPLRPRARPRQLLTEPALPRRGIAAFEQIGHLFPAVARATVESGLFAKMGDHFLARSPGGAHRFAQRPIFVSLPIDGAAVAAKEHGPHHRRQQLPPAMGSSPLHAQPRRLPSHTETSVAITLKYPQKNSTADELGLRRPFIA